MFDLFRFFMLRPPEQPTDGNEIPIAEGGKLHEQLKGARAGEEPLASMRGIAEDFVKTSEFVGLPKDAHHATALDTLRTALLGKPHAHLPEIKTLVRNAFGAAPSEVAASETFLRDKTRVHQSLLAIKLASSVVQKNMGHLPLYARLINLVERTAADDPTLNEIGTVARALTRLLILPADLFPLPSPLEQRRAEDPPVPTGTGGGSGVEAATKRAAAIEGALNELSTLTGDDFSAPMIAPAPAARPAGGGETESERPGFFAQLLRLFSPASVRPTTTALASKPVSIGPRFILKPESIAQLQPQSHAVLRELKVDLTATPAPAAIRLLRSELSRVQQELAAATPKAGDIVAPTTASSGAPGAPAGAVPPPPLPKIHGHIKPVGMADLLVVKYQLLRYERGEVAYIENILKGESSRRSVRRLETTEETTVLETETTKEEERDLQSTERFELKNETENTVSAEGNLKSGNPFSPSYGPMLEFQGGTDAPLAGSQTQSSRQASNYSREVTSRSASKVTERVRKQVTLRKLREFEEKTNHSFNNTEADAANVTGVFQWVEKVIQGQVFNYGRRLMFDIMVPEPAAFLQQAMMGTTPAAQGLIKPAEFKLGPDEIHEWNYSHLAATYGATGIEPPPEQSITVSKKIEGKNDGCQAVEQPILPGYQASSCLLWVQGRFLLDPDPPNKDIGTMFVDVTIGSTFTSASFSNPPDWWFPLSNEVSSVAMIVTAYRSMYYAVTVEIFCVPTAQNTRAWQSRTHDAILRAYQARLAEYEERLANLQASSRVEALGRNPDENLKLIKDELKKSCISIFTYQQFDFFHGVELSPQGFVQISLAAAESQGEFIRFFEQAFEWEQMIYLFYPYFWGTKFFWLFKLRLDEVDPRLKDFLKAGEARVTVPVRPGFEKAVAHYLETGELWNGSDPLDITSDTYLPIIKEIQERDAIPGAEVPYGDPWEVRLPTTLVSLRDDGKLPRWKEEPKGSGQWVEEVVA
jgi:hypothetical protein